MGTPQMGGCHMQSVRARRDALGGFLGEPDQHRQHNFFLLEPCATPRHPTFAIQRIDVRRDERKFPGRLVAADAAKCYGTPCILAPSPRLGGPFAAINKSTVIGATPRIMQNAELGQRPTGGHNVRTIAQRLRESPLRRLPQPVPNPQAGADFHL